MQETPEILFVTIRLPPLTVRLARLFPVTWIADPVAVVISKIVSPFGVTKLRRIPEFVKLKVVEPLRVRLCPELVADTENVAPRRPVIEKFGTRETTSFAAGIVHELAPVPLKFNVIFPLIWPPAYVVQPSKVLTF